MKKATQTKRNPTPPDFLLLNSTGISQMCGLLLCSRKDSYIAGFFLLPCHTSPKKVVAKKNMSSSLKREGERCLEIQYILTTKTAGFQEIKIYISSKPKKHHL